MHNWDRETTNHLRDIDRVNTNSHVRELKLINNRCSEKYKISDRKKVRWIEKVKERVKKFRNIERKKRKKERKKERKK